MSILTRIVVTSLQLPGADESVSELRAKAVQQINAEPAESTPEATENGEETVPTQPTQGA